MRHWIIQLVVLAGLASVGCEPAYEAVDHPTGDEVWERAHDIEPDDDEIVATVDGHPVVVDDLEAKWREMPEASRSEVYDDLIERETLALEARRRGVYERPEVAFARKQGLVSALLAERVEAEAEIDESRRDEIRDHARQVRRVPEGLRASHLVVLVPEDHETEEGETVEFDEDRRAQLYEEAEDYVREARRMFEGQVDNLAVREVADRLAEKLPAELDVEVNEHMRFPRYGERFEPEHLPDGWVPVVPEFARGAETVAGDNSRGRELSEPVRTDFGWHLIRVDEVLEERPVDPEVLDEYAQFELRRGARQARLHEKMEQWAEGVPAQVHPERLGSPLEE